MIDSNMSSLRDTGSFLFSIPDFFIGFGSKVLSDSDSVRSPTSPLDFKPFSNLSNPFRIGFGRSSSQNGNQKKWESREEGLSIINSLVEETKSTNEVLGASKRKNIIFRPEVLKNTPSFLKTCCDSDDYSIKSQSLPRNYMIRPPSETITTNPQLEAENRSVSWNVGSHTLLSDRASSQNGSIQEDSLGFKPSSLPVPIGSTHQYVSFIPDREIELSEDYTCIISHGPNPKTTHVFCDCVLECHTNELKKVDKEISGIKSPRAAMRPEGLLTHGPSNENLRFCYTCKKNLEGEEVYLCRSEKAFCSFDCHSEKIFSE